MTPEITKRPHTFEELMKEIENGVTEISGMLDDERRRTSYYIGQVRQKEEIISKLSKICDGVVRAWEGGFGESMIDPLIRQLKEIMIEHSLMEGQDDDNSNQ